MNNCEECGWPEPCDCEPERSAGSLERAGSAATCEWETVAPAKICGEPAAYEDINGKKFCERHGHHLVKRYPTTMTKLEVPPNAEIKRPGNGAHKQNCGDQPGSLASNG